MKKRKVLFAITLQMLMTFAESAIVDLVCPPLLEMLSHSAGLQVTWLSTEEAEAQTDAAVFWDYPDFSENCRLKFKHGPFQNILKFGDVMFRGLYPAECVVVENNDFSAYFFIVKGNHEIISSDDILYKATCRYEIKQNVTLPPSVVLTQSLKWADHGSSIVRNEKINMNLPHFGFPRTAEGRLVPEGVMLGDLIYFEMHFTVDPFWSFGVDRATVYPDNCIGKPGCPRLQLYEHGCPTREAAQSVALQRPVSDQTFDFGGYMLMRTTGTFRSFRFLNPGAPSGLVVLFSIRRCTQYNDPRCRVIDCKDTRVKRSEKAKAAEDAQNVVEFASPALYVKLNDTEETVLQPDDESIQKKLRKVFVDNFTEQAQPTEFSEVNSEKLLNINFFLGTAIPLLLVLVASLVISYKVHAWKREKKERESVFVAGSFVKRLGEEALRPAFRCHLTSQHSNNIDLLSNHTRVL